MMGLRGKSGEYLEKVFNSIGDGVLVYDSDFTILDVNPAALGMLGFKREEVVGQKCYETSHHKGAPCADVLCPIVEMIEGHTLEKGVVHEHYRKDGTPIILEITAAPMTTADGELEAVVAVLRDITERKRIEEALKESERLARAISETSADAIVVMDGEGAIKYMNPSAERMFGYKQEEAMGRGLHDFLVSDRAGREFYQRLPEFQRTGSCRVVGKTLELEARRKDGTRFPIELSVTSMKVRGEWHAVGTVRDITQRKRVEDELKRHRDHLEDLVKERTAELRESQERYQELFENANDIIYTLDLEGNFTSVNRAAEEISGYTWEEFQGMNIAQVVAPEHLDLVRRMIERKIDQGIRTCYELEIVTKEGRRVPLEVNSRIIHREGKPVEVQGIARDITERKKAEKEMKQRLMRYRLEDGALYLVQEPGPVLSLEAFWDLLQVGYHGLLISRTPEKRFRRDFGGEYRFLWLAEGGGAGTIPPRVEDILTSIEELPRRTAVLVDRLDYLVFKEGFKKTLSLVHRLREQAYLGGLVVILSLDPGTLDRREFRMLEKEAREVVPRVSGLPGGDQEVMRFIQRQNSLGRRPSLTQVGTGLGLSRPTVRKRVRRLASGGYLKEIKKGRSKQLELTERGRRWFST
jgi:PAS domain S-box-containing protein